MKTIRNQAAVTLALAALAHSACNTTGRGVTNAATGR